MAINQNPYAPPQADCQAEAPPNEIGVWRQGDLLVMSREAVLPRRCLISGEPVAEYQKWHLESMGAALEAPISEVVDQRHRFHGAIALCLAIGGVAVLVAGMFWVQWAFLGPPIEIAGIGIALMLGGIVWGFLTVQNRLALHASTDSHLWISGVHLDYLADLPEWPYQPK